MAAVNASFPITSSNNADYLLARCWRIQDCYSCLHTSDPCSWCAVSSTCVSNEAPIGLLAPIWNPKICPIHDERWELRAKGLGCKVSTLTFLSVLISVLATVVVVLWLWAARKVWIWLPWRWRKDRLGYWDLRARLGEAWTRFWTWGNNAQRKDLSESQDEGEHTRLLV